MYSIRSDLIYASPLLPRDALALFANNCPEGSQSTGQITSMIQSGPFPVRPAPKKRKDFIPVNHWTWKEFRHACVVHTNAQRGETNGSAVKGFTPLGPTWATIVGDGLAVASLWIPPEV